MLWHSMPEGKFAIPNRLVRFFGETHYVPPQNQRARLARKWLYMRATYGCDLLPPSKAQIFHSSEIIALAKHTPVYGAEQRVNNLLRSQFDLSNPLLDSNASRWFDDAHWRSLVFPR